MKKTLALALLAAASLGSAQQVGTFSTWGGNGYLAQADINKQNCKQLWTKSLTAGNGAGWTFSGGWWKNYDTPLTFNYFAWIEIVSLKQKDGTFGPELTSSSENTHASISGSTTSAGKQVIPIFANMRGQVGVGPMPEAWPDATNGVNGFTKGYYRFDAYSSNPNTSTQSPSSSCEHLGSVYAYCTGGAWSTDPPKTTPNWTTGSATAGAVGDLRIQVERKGYGFVGDGVRVDLKNIATQQSTFDTTFGNGLVKFGDIPPGKYSFAISGNALENKQLITYTGGGTFTKTAAPTTLHVVADVTGAYTKVDIETDTDYTDPTLPTAGGSGSSHDSSTDNVNQTGWWGNLFSSLFVPQASTVNSLKTSTAAMAGWGPFGFLQAINLQASAVGNDPYYQNNFGPTYMVPSFNPATGNFDGPTPADTANYDMGRQWADSPMYQSLRTCCKWALYVMFAAGLVAWLKPRFSV